jgi:hypothetical protein
MSVKKAIIQFNRGQLDIDKAIELSPLKNALQPNSRQFVHPPRTAQATEVIFHFRNFRLQGTTNSHNPNDNSGLALELFLDSNVSSPSSFL